MDLFVLKTLYFIFIMAPFLVISHNVGGNSVHLGGLLHYLVADKPDLVLLQEVPAVIGTEAMATKVKSLGYNASCNVDEEDNNSVGTACLWKNSVPVESIHVNDLDPNRLQVIKIENFTFLNVYAPAGTNQRAQRRDFYGSTLFSGVYSLKNQSGFLPIIGGDHNCVLSAIDTEGFFNKSHKYCKTLSELVNTYGYRDAFRATHPTVKEYTWHRPGSSSSRIDRFYIPPYLLQNLIDITHSRTLSDHYRVNMVLNLNLSLGPIPPQPK